MQNDEFKQNQDERNLLNPNARRISQRKSITGRSREDGLTSPPTRLEGNRSLSFAGDERPVIPAITSDDEKDSLNGRDAEKPRPTDADTKSLSQRSARSKGSAVSGRSGNSRGASSKVSGGANSFGSDDSSVSGGRGKSVADTAVRKLMYMRSVFIAFALHAVYLAGLLILGSKQGMILPFNQQTFTNAGPIVAIVWSRASFLVLDSAMNEAFGAFVGYLLSRKEGYSIAACGFVHSNFGEKMSFANKLSFRSTAKPLLSKISLVWLVHFINLFLSMMAASSISALTSQVDSTALMCILYEQVGDPKDRGLPTLVNEMGGAEMIDGTGLGYLRSQNMDTLKNTIHAIPPQLIDVCQDGSTIKGKGFTTNISTSCYCANGIDVKSLQVAGIPLSLASSMSIKAIAQENFPGWVNAVTTDLDKNITTIYTLLNGHDTCAGFQNPNNANSTSSAPVCISTLTDHRNSQLRVTYKTDGTPASIAAKQVDILEFGELASMSWLHQSVLNLLEINSLTNTSSHYLPSHWPGSVNPLLWFTSENMQSVSLGLLEPGMEAAMAFIVRASIQRSYSSVGSFCTQQIYDPMSVTLRMEQFGYVCGCIWITVQFLILGFVTLLYAPWWIQKTPILPAIDASQQHIIFSLLSSKNPATYNRMKSMSSNLEAGLMWPRLDLVLRIGESVQTVEDPERGVIAMDKPKFVTALSFDKVYV